MPISSRLVATAVLVAAVALPAAAQERPERADTVEFKIGRRVQIIRAPGSERQQRIEIRRGGDTTDVRLDVDPEMVDRWMRRILVLDSDSADARTDDDSLGVPVRVRLRTRRAPHNGERISEERTLEFRSDDGQSRRIVLHDGEPLHENAPEIVRDVEIVRRDADGTVRPGRPSGLWVERLDDGERPGSDVTVLRDDERPGGDVRVRREALVREENVRVTRDGDVLRIERSGEPARTLPLRRPPGAQPDGTLVVPDGKGGTWIYLPPRPQN